MAPLKPPLLFLRYSTMTAFIHLDLGRLRPFLLVLRAALFFLGILIWRGDKFQRVKCDDRRAIVLRIRDTVSVLFVGTSTGLSVHKNI